MQRIQLIGAILCAVVAAAGETATSAEAPQHTFVGKPMGRERATQIVRNSGYDLIDVHPCFVPSDSCVRVAVKAKDGEAHVYELDAESCRSPDNACLGGLIVRDRLGSGRRPKGSAGSSTAAAKIQAAPGKDGAPPDPQDEAQADATNEILEALGDGKYDGKLDQFWRDLESIQTWNNASWIEPDPDPPVQDSIRLTNGHDTNPAVLVSGRFKDEQGVKDCGYWVGNTSTTSTIDLSRNWMSNAIADGCDSEIAVFSENGAALLNKPEGRWSRNSDRLDVSLGPRIEVPTTIWVLQPKTDFAAEQSRLEGEIDVANAVLKKSRCGIRLYPIDIKDKSTAALDPDEPLGCASIESVFKPIGFHPNKMNVYIVNALIASDRAGVACTAESDNVIVLDKGRSSTAMVHEFGHWFDLWHVTQEAMPLVNVNNIMSTEGSDDMFTAGQCYRMNFSKDSYINKQGLRTGRTKNCRHLQDADGQCPGLKNEF
jgi:hypothetical protein